MLQISQRFAFAFLTTLMLVYAPASVKAEQWSKEMHPISAAQKTETDHDFRHVLVELSLPPAAQTFSAAVTAAGAGDVNATTVAATQAQLARIDAQQQQLLTELAQLDAEVLYRLQRVYNGFAMRIPADSLEAVAQLDGVVAIHRLTPVTPDNANSVPSIGAPSLWQGVDDGRFTGRGITIAVIDTGIDYLHATFGGSGAYMQNDPTVIGDVADFPGAKIVAGYDFAGDDYDADPTNKTYNPIPVPDPDPADCYNHGTHVAGTAAGYGVLASEGGRPGIVFRGPYDETTYLHRFEVGPGVAPEASIVALKIFGCKGSSDLTPLAIEWAVDPNGDGNFSDRVDVINMSLGSTYGSIHDPTAIAADNAALTGIIVVASAGNARDTYFVVGSPAVADRVIGVAASSDIVATESARPLVEITGFSSRGPRRHDWALKPDIAAPGKNIISAADKTGWEGTQFSGTSMAAPHVAGAMALLRGAHPDWRVDELKALIMNTSRMQTGVESTASPTRTGAGQIDLRATLRTDVVALDARPRGRVSISFAPADVIDRYSALETLQVVNRGTEPISYTVSYAGVIDTPGVLIAPERPTVTVPGGGVATMAVRLDADASVMRHTRDPNVDDMQRYPRHWISEEAGQLLLWPDNGFLQAELDSTNFPSTEQAGALGAVDARFDPRTGLLELVIGVAQLKGSVFDLVELRHGSAAHGGGELVSTVMLTPGAAADPLQLSSATDDNEGLQATMTVSGTATISEEHIPLLAQGELYIRLEHNGTQPVELRGQLASSSPVLHLPVYASVRPLADLRVPDSVLTFEANEPNVQPLMLTGVDRTGDMPPEELISLVSLLELQYADINNLPYPGTDGQADIFDHADLKYVGITSDFPLDRRGPIGDRTLYFGVSTYADWTSPNEVEVNIYIDVDEDGEDDFRLFNSDVLGFESETVTSDAFVTVVEELRREKFSQPQLLNLWSPLAYDTRPYGSNVMLLPVKASDIGLSSTNPDFYYRVETLSNESTIPIDETPTLAYNLRVTAFDFFSPNIDAPLFRADVTRPIMVRLQLEEYLQLGMPDLLLLHHHNAAGVRDERVKVELTWPESVYLPYFIHSETGEKQ